MKIIAVSPQYARQGTNLQRALDRQICREMDKPNGVVNSASGMTATVAINYCERKGLPYVVYACTIMEGGVHRYSVQRLQPTIVPKAVRSRRER